MKDLYAKLRRCAVALTIALVTTMAAQPAMAVVPEIVRDPQTGQYIPHPDLEAALALFGKAPVYAEFRWRRAPWFAS